MIIFYGGLDLVQNLYDGARRLKRKGASYWSLIYKFHKLLAIILVPLRGIFQKSYGLDDNSRIIVSLTSFDKRIGQVWITISTLLCQSVKPKKIILWLAKSQFPGERQAIPKRLIKMEKRGLEIRFVDEDIRSHKKYYYAMKEYPDDFVVTVDDDMIYPENCLEQLMNTYKKHPDCVCAQFAHWINVGDDGKLAPYMEWTSCYGESTEPDMHILPVGCGGVLYPPHLLNENVLNMDDIKLLCPQMDDLWLKSMAVINDVKAVICDECSLIYFDVPGNRAGGLYKVNAEQNVNDVAMNAIIDKYPEVLEKISASTRQG